MFFFHKDAEEKLFLNSTHHPIHKLHSHHIISFCFLLFRSDIPSQAHILYVCIATRRFLSTFTSTVRVLFLITDEYILWTKRSEDLKKRKALFLKEKKLQDICNYCNKNERNIVLFRGFIFMSTVTTNRYQF